MATSSRDLKPKIKSIQLAKLRQTYSNSRNCYICRTNSEGFVPKLMSDIRFPSVFIVKGKLPELYKKLDRQKNSRIISFIPKGDLKAVIIHNYQTLRKTRFW
jgi:hypothetical protein